MPEHQSANLQALTDLCTPWCIHTVATLRIADHIAAGATDIDALATAAGCDAGVLQSVLRYLIAKGVFHEPALGRFELNDAARQLLDPSLRLGLDLNGIGGRFAGAWSTLPAYVRTGKPAYHERFGRPFWEDLDAHPQIGASFDALMGPAGHGAPDPQVLVNNDWDSVQTVVDVGGGTGALLAQILRAHPAIHGTLVDLPRTVARSAEAFQAAGVANRVTTAGQSFFDPLPPGADLYLLAKILSNWPDAETTVILRRCAEAARPAGRVVVLGGASPDDVPAALTIELMLLGGKHRTIAEFQNLAREAGMTVHATGRLPSGSFAVECRPA